MTNMKRKARAALLAVTLGLSAVVASSAPAAADVSTYCGHGTSWIGLWSTRFLSEYQQPRSTYPWIETVHVYEVYRKGGKRGTEWFLDHIETRVCHAP